MRNAPLNFNKPLNAKKRIAAEYADKGIDKQMIKDITADSGFDTETDTLINVTNNSLRKRAIQSNLPNQPYRNRVSGTEVLKVQKDPFKNKFLPAEKEAVKTARFGKATHGVKDLEDAYGEQGINRRHLNFLNVQKGDTAIVGSDIKSVWDAQTKLAGKTKTTPLPVKARTGTFGTIKGYPERIEVYSKQDLIDSRKKDQELDALLPNMRRNKRNKRIRK
tara:strand:+ start:93 stop:752 length:660 start_codon:yes stop_codon:yes gene_type:complete